MSSNRPPIKKVPWFYIISVLGFLCLLANSGFTLKERTLVIRCVITAVYPHGNVCADLATGYIYPLAIRTDPNYEIIDFIGKEKDINEAIKFSDLKTFIAEIDNYTGSEHLFLGGLPTEYNRYIESPVAIKYNPNRIKNKTIESPINTNNEDQINENKREKEEKEEKVCVSVESIEAFNKDRYIYIPSDSNNNLNKVSISNITEDSFKYTDNANFTAFDKEGNAFQSLAYPSFDPIDSYTPEEQNSKDYLQKQIKRYKAYKQLPRNTKGLIIKLSGSIASGNFSQGRLTKFNNYRGQPEFTYIKDAPESFFEDCVSDPNYILKIPTEKRFKVDGVDYID